MAEWDTGVHAREGFTDAEKKRMTLSQDTLEGLQMSGINTCIKFSKKNAFLTSTQFAHLWRWLGISFLRSLDFTFCQKGSTRIHWSPSLGSSEHERDEVTILT